MKVLGRILAVLEQIAADVHVIKQAITNKDVVKLDVAFEKPIPQKEPSNA
jgi:hypothetical protein